MPLKAANIVIKSLFVSFLSFSVFLSLPSLLIFAGAFGLVGGTCRCYSGWKTRGRMKKDIPPSPFLLTCLPPRNFVSHFAWPFLSPSLTVRSLSLCYSLHPSHQCHVVSIYIYSQFLACVPPSNPKKTHGSKTASTLILSLHPLPSVPTARTHERKDDSFLSPSPLPRPREATVGVLPLSHLPLAPSFLFFCLHLPLTVQSHAPPLSFPHVPPRHRRHF